MRRLLVVLFAVGVMTAPGTAKAHMLHCSMKDVSKKSYACALRQRHHGVTAVRFAHRQRALYGTNVIVRNHRWLARRAQRSIDAYMLSDWRLYLVSLVGSGTAYGCALPLIGRESGGVVTKYNYAGSGAYGLGQALPASKMSPYGRDYMTNGVTQIRWMHVYVNRYGGWCGANAFQASHGYY